MSEIVPLVCVGLINTPIIGTALKAECVLFFAF